MLNLNRCLEVVERWLINPTDKAGDGEEKDRPKFVRRMWIKWKTERKKKQIANYVKLLDGIVETVQRSKHVGQNKQKRHSKKA